MKIFRTLISCVVILLFVFSANGQNSASGNINGSIVEQMPYKFPAYEEQPDYVKRFYSREEYDKAKNSTELECLKIKYISDGLKVVGFIVRPKKVVGKKYPVIIFNRGGFLENAKLDLWYILDFYRMASEGFVILASQYRGNDGGEGKEEMGGADVNDVMNLMPLAKSLEYADMNNVFMCGASRGGMMAFLALKKGMTVNAVAVIGALIDVEAITKRNPLLIAVAKQLIPDYGERGAESLRDRSVINWTDKINTPLLMIHGADDRQIPATEPLALAMKLHDLKKAYELVIYANEIHETMNNREDRNARITRWFKKYIK